MTSGDDPRRAFTVSLRQSDYEFLRFNARRTGKTMSLYLTDCLRPPVEQVDGALLREVLAELRVLNRQVQGEATNINQIAAWANTNQQFPIEADAVARDLRRQVGLINEVRLAIGDLL